MKNKILVFLFLLLSNIILGNTIDDKKDQLNRIDEEIIKKGNEIKRNTEKIKTIEKKTETTKEQISRLEKELKVIDGEKKILKDKIEVVSRKIDYGKRNLKFNSKELTSVENDYIALLQAWQKKELQDDNDIYNFKEILNSNQERQDKIRNVQQNITEVKSDIEREQKNLKSLQSQLAAKEKQQVSKKREKDNLIVQYNREKQDTAAKTDKAKNSISNLQKQKAEIEKEIERIIKQRTTQVGNIGSSAVTKNLGTFKKPINGSVIVKFNQLKDGGVRSSGQEIKGNLGDIVVAGNKGKVIYSGKFMNMGEVVMIDHGYNLITIYGNLISSRVKLGEEVTKGKKIGILGLNLYGNSYLYYETRFNLKSVNPDTF